MPVLLSDDAVGRAVRPRCRWKVRSLAPILVLATLSAVPVLVLMVLVAPVTLTVPPLIALKPVLAPVVSMSSPPEKLIVAPLVFWSLLSRLMPRPLSSIAAGEVDGAAAGDGRARIGHLDRAAGGRGRDGRADRDVGRGRVDVDAAGGGVGDRAAGEVDAARARRLLTVSISTPLAAPLVLTVAKVMPLAPTVTPLRSSAVPVPEVIELLPPVTLTVPPPVALKPVRLLALVLMSRPPSKLIVAPVLVLRKSRRSAGVGGDRAVEVDGAAGLVDDLDGLAVGGVGDGAVIVDAAVAAVDRRPRCRSRRRARRRRGSSCR